MLPSGLCAQALRNRASTGTRKIRHRGHCHEKEKKRPERLLHPSGGQSGGAALSPPFSGCRLASFRPGGAHAFPPHTFRSAGAFARGHFSRLFRRPRCAPRIHTLPSGRQPRQHLAHAQRTGGARPMLQLRRAGQVLRLVRKRRAGSRSGVHGPSARNPPPAGGRCQGRL